MLACECHDDHVGCETSKLGHEVAPSLLHGLHRLLQRRFANGDAHEGGWILLRERGGQRLLLPCRLLLLCKGLGLLGSFAHSGKKSLLALDAVILLVVDDGPGKDVGVVVLPLADLLPSELVTIVHANHGDARVARPLVL